jgi:ATP-binding cassette, subfamily C, bacterial exporter for protease/lipase
MSALRKRIPKNEITDALFEFKAAFRSIGAFSGCVNLFMLVPAIYMMQVYDRVLASRNDFTLVMLSLIALGLFAIISALEFVRSMVVIRVGAKIDAFLNQRIYTAAFEQNLKSAGINAGQALSDLNTIRQFVTGSGMFAFFDAPWFPLYLAVLFILNPVLGLFALVSTSVLIALAWINELVSSAALNEANSVAVQSTTMATNNLRNAEVIEAMGMLPNMRERWFSLHSKFLQLQAQASKKAATITAITKFVKISVQSLILGLAAYLVIKNQLTAGAMIAATVLMGRALGPVEQIIGVWRQWRGVLSAYHRLNELLQNNPLRKQAMSLPIPQGAVKFEQVSAAPPGSKQLVLKNINFELAAGEVMGLIGPSGSGKSTLARLLVGIWPASIGTVRLDNADVYQWNKDELGPHIGFLPQDIELFSGTIAENISRFGKIDSDKVIAAAKLAGVHDLILHMPEGYETQIGDSGAGLSGGQKQRIGMARALYGDPAMIVLDEPNSNLDDMGELALAKTLVELRERKKTIVIISHRPSIIRVTQKIMLLQNGAVIAFGPSRQVLEAIEKARNATPPPATAPFQINDTTLPDVGPKHE